MSDSLEEALHQISLIVDGVATQQCARHYGALTQEHQFTSGLARAIERELEAHPVEGAQLEVRAQEFPDRGPGSLEKRTGSDLYISVVRTDGDGPVSKGMLVQSKWDRALAHSSERRKLRNQAHTMLEKTDESYVWVYGPTGVAVVPARAPLVIDSPPWIADGPTTVGELIAAGLRCTAGDRRIGRDVRLPLVDGLNAIQERLAAATALSFSLRPDTD